MILNCIAACLTKSFPNSPNLLIYNTSENNSYHFQTERESLRRQLDQLQRDLALTGDTHNKLTGQIHELEKENAVYKNRVEENTHKNKVDLTNLKMEMLKQRGELERERDKLLNVVDGRYI